MQAVYDENYNSAQLRKIYKKAYYEVENDIKKLYDVIADGGELTTTQLYQYDRFLTLRNKLKRQAGTIKSTLNDDVTETLSSAYRSVFEVTGEMLGKNDAFSIVSKHDVRAVLKKKWLGENFSSRIWRNADSAAREVEAAVVNCITRGIGKDVYVKQIMNKYETAFHNADRLVRTELMHTLNTAETDAYRAAGVTRVEWYASEDERMCKVCGKLHGHIFDIEDIGTKIDPIAHANCRCTLLPVVDGLTKTADGNGVSTPKSTKSVDFSAKSDIINEKAENKITAITDNAISKVKRVEIDGFDTKQNDYIHSQHKELLQYARDNNESKEVAFVFRKDLSDKTVFKGNDDSVDFGNALTGKGSGLFVMHNHPGNSSFSNTDIVFFKNCDALTTITIIKNNGNIEYLTKKPEYDYKRFELEYDRLKTKIVKNGTASEYDKFIKTLLKKSKSGIRWSENDG